MAKSSKVENKDDSGAVILENITLMTRNYGMPAKLMERCSVYGSKRGENTISHYKVSTKFILNIDEFVFRSETTLAAECQELGSYHYRPCHDSLDNAFVNWKVQRGLK